MSARVVIPAPLRGLRHTRVSSACNAVSSASYPASSVKRDLFGPVNHEETRQFVEQELESYQDECRTKWNFDFIDEIPYTGRYEWKLTVERPGRRAEKRQRNDDDVNNEHLYYEPEDDPLPTPAKRTYSTTTPPLKGQTKITGTLQWLRNEIRTRRITPYRSLFPQPALPAAG